MERDLVFRHVRTTSLRRVLAAAVVSMVALGEAVAAPPDEAAATGARLGCARYLIRTSSRYSSGERPIEFGEMYLEQSSGRYVYRYCPQLDSHAAAVLDLDWPLPFVVGFDGKRRWDASYVVIKNRVVRNLRYEILRRLVGRDHAWRVEKRERLDKSLGRTLIFRNAEEKCERQWFELSQLSPDSFDSSLQWNEAGATPDGMRRQVLEPLHALLDYVSVPSFDSPSLRDRLRSDPAFSETVETNGVRTVFHLSRLSNRQRHGFDGDGKLISFWWYERLTCGNEWPIVERLDVSIGCHMGPWPYPVPMDFEIILVDRDYDPPTDLFRPEAYLHDL